MMTSFRLKQNADFGPGSVAPDKFLGFKAKGRIVALVGNPGTLAVTPGTSVVATDMLLLGGAAPAGAGVGCKFVSVLNPGASTFTVKSTGDDQSAVTWALFDNTFLG